MTAEQARDRGIEICEEHELEATKWVIGDGGCYRHIMRTFFDEAGFEKALNILTKAAAPGWIYQFAVQNRGRLSEEQLNQLFDAMLWLGSADWASLLVLHMNSFVTRDGLSEERQRQLLELVIASEDAEMATRYVELFPLHGREDEVVAVVSGTVWERTFAVLAKDLSPEHRERLRASA